MRANMRVFSAQSQQLACHAGGISLPLLQYPRETPGGVTEYPMGFGVDRPYVHVKGPNPTNLCDQALKLTHL
jgi:hypothetical protein